MGAPITNIEELDFHGFEHGQRFAARVAMISRGLGARKLGYNVTVVPPGKCSTPFHCHRVNEEMFFVLEGVGELRLGEERHALRRGDVVACPPGGADTAHQIRNTSNSEELRYLAVSTMESPEIAEYPDSGKYGILAEFPRAGDEPPETLRFVAREQARLEDYWEGE